MAIATGAAIALGIGAAASAGGAAYQAHQAGKASKAQENASNRALDMQRDVYNDQMRMVNPYVQMGTDSFARLYSDHYGVPYAGTPYTGQPYAPSAPMGPSMPPDTRRFGGISLAQMAQPQGYGQSQGALGIPSYGSPAGGAPIMLRAPTGETMPVHDPQEAQRLIAAGAKEVR